MCAIDNKVAEAITSLDESLKKLRAAAAIVRLDHISDESHHAAKVAWSYAYADADRATKALLESMGGTGD